MSDVQRPTVLTVLAVLTIIWGVFGIIANIIVVAAGAIAGAFILILGLAGLAIAVVSLLAGIGLLGNKKLGINMLRIYAFSALGYQALYIIYYLIKGLPIGWASTAIGIAIPAAILYMLLKNEEVISYGNSLE